MKRTILFLMFSFMGYMLFAQDKEAAEKLVNEGIAYHDKGDYNGAIVRYDKALELDKDNILALSEKALTLQSLKKYDESIKCCQRAIKKHPGDDCLKSVYVYYGNALDELKETDKSIKLYDEGIKQFPDFYQLHFNKGITLWSVKKYDEAILCFQRAISLNPKHAGSHNAIARILNIENKRIPALLAYCRFLVIEPQTKRAKENLEFLQTIMKGSVKKTGDKEISVNITTNMLVDSTANGKTKENSFQSTDLLLAMDAALDYDAKNKDKTEVEKFIRKFDTVCASLEESQKNNYGFYWSYYAPYFIEMKNKSFIETFAYIAFASSDDPAVSG
ncbi:MAG: tetratricopeptide repeat protein, partial [Bacteroidota bacterium]|nr:tetratricopeptide repeat protein [Bacteroidota bacterium]